jgi:signal transduction histidine kinase
VFDNLISNAIKFTADGSNPEIHIGAGRKDNQVCFSVRDNGIGIPPQQRERIFEPFVRLNPDSAKGSGIGLAIVKRIIELYDGRVWIESEEEQGCVVMFTLPALGELPGMHRPAKHAVLFPS